MVATDLVFLPQPANVVGVRCFAIPGLGFSFASAPTEQETSGDEAGLAGQVDDGGGGHLGAEHEVPATSSRSQTVVDLNPLEGARTLACSLGVPDAQQVIIEVARPVPGLNKVAFQAVPALALPLRTILPALVNQQHHPRASVRGFAALAQLALIAVMRQEVIPSLMMGDGDAPVLASWQVSADAAIHNALVALSDALPRVALAAAPMTILPPVGEAQPDQDEANQGAVNQPEAAQVAPSQVEPIQTAPIQGDAAGGDAMVYTPLHTATCFVNAVVDTVLRGMAPTPSGRPRARILPWTLRWLEALGDPTDAHVPWRDDAPELVASIDGWQSRIDGDITLVIELDAPEDPHGAWPIRVLAQRGDGAILPVHDLLGGADTQQANDALAQLSRASRLFAPLDGLLEHTTTSCLWLDLDQAWTFIAQATPLLSGAGVHITLPATLTDDAMAAQVHLSERPDGQVEALWEVALADEVLDEEDLAMIDGLDQPLVFARGRWIRLDEASRQAMATKGHREVMTRAEALSLALAGSAGEDWFTSGRAVQRVMLDDSLAAFIDAIRNAGDKPELETTPDGFHGTLRDYQARGVAWLRAMTDLGLGAVLADAMGLGKTIQLIALMVTRPGPFLVVCPTSVVSNWEREIRRFAPDLPVVRHHGIDRQLDPDQVEGAVVTSYGTLRRDADLLTKVAWDVVTLDEAQHIKNPSTTAAKVVRQLTTSTTLALTGTPMENRLAELWAVIDATNAGMLGSKQAFTRRFVKPIEGQHNPRAAKRLRNLVAPFVMRRTKDDPEVVRDLPPKIERVVDCTLTSEQARLYKQVTKTAMDELAKTDGIARRGRILAMLTALKQVTNHPAQYLNETGPLVGRSGKLQAAQEIITSITDAGEQALIFTQFVAMGHLLSRQLSADLGQPIPFLHGGLSLAQRDTMVEQFQAGGGPGVLIISTRAGGTGLNLTAATHVLHYDRWWNPAVEDQATDRAHRIGQSRTVEVHKLVTMGTLEERIAEMLERKRALADAVVAPGESWITELDLEALEALVSLSADARVYDAPDLPVGVSQEEGTDA